jgi:hypothetical protein
MKTMSTRDTIAELVGAAGGAGGEEPVDEGPGEGGEGGGLDDGVGGEDAPVEAQPESEQAPLEAKSGPARAPDGKFTAADKAPAPVDPAPAPAPAPKPEAAPKLKPPANWRPAAQAEFDKLPRVVQEESLRIHAEVSKTLNDTASHRQAAETWQRTLAPYEHMFRAVGKSPVEGVGWLVQQYAALQTAPIPHRAAILGGLVRDFLGTDTASIQLLADALEGKGGGGPTAPAAPLRPEQIQQLVRQEAQRMQGEASQQAEIKAIQDFEDSKPEYLPSLTNEITALVAIEKRQGKPITVEMLKQVHAKALRLNPETAAILKQRDDAAAAAKRAADDKKKQAAATGIKNEPAGPGAPAKAVSTRDEVKRQMDRLKGGARV